MEELIKKEEVEKIWDKLDTDRAFNKVFKGREKATITRKELREYTINVVVKMSNALANQLVKDR